MSVYNPEFYRAQVTESRLSACHVIPVLFQFFRPSSVIDVGCGCGAWLSEFKRFGVADLLGLDGSYVNSEQLLIAPNEFVATDLNGDFSNFPDRRFDLAVSLEVAEHLAMEHAADFIASLVKLADIVLFSAALPYQGGTAHVNENWLEYWALLFRRHAYHPVDCIRPVIWDNKSVCWWYRQNIMVFTTSTIATRVFGQAENVMTSPLSMIHPEFFASAYWRNYRGGHQRMLQDIHNFRELCSTYADLSAVSPPETTMHYRETHAVRFDGLVYRFRNLLNRILTRRGRFGDR
jgi:hypothetical protein